MFELVLACAPAVAPETTLQIIDVESKGDPLAININRRKGEKFAPRLKRKATDVADAVEITKSYIAQGYTVDMGLMQINSANLRGLGYRVEDMFEPCKNIAAGARVLGDFYAQAVPRYQGEQAALQAALSAYNTGNFTYGFSNGYVANYVGKSKPMALGGVSAVNLMAAGTAVYTTTPNYQKKIKDKFMINSEQVNELVLPVVSESENDSYTPGVQVEYTADEAELFGAFDETAILESDAWESNSDLETNEPEPKSTAIIIAGKKVNRGG